MTAPLWLLKAGGLIKRIPWQVWAALAILGVWLWERDRHADAREVEVRAEMQITIDRMDAARKAAIANRDRIETANTKATEKADTDVAQDLVQERAGADAFIARGGVRQCPATRADPAPGSQGAVVDEGNGALPFVDDVPVVAVLPEDVRICTENTVKARAWREWGLSIDANQQRSE